MIWVGITGGLGCGKSTVISFLEKQGFGVVSADQIVHDLYLSPDVVKNVSELLKIDKKIFSKEEVAKLVFSNKESLVKLEGYLHPLVRKETENRRRAYEKSGEQIAFYEVPLLFEKNMQSHFDCTLCVGAEYSVQMERIKKRNTWSEKEIEGRLTSQLPLEKKKELADFYIDNSFDLETLEKACLSLVEEIKKSAQELKK